MSLDKPVSLLSLAALKREQRAFAVVTAYDASFAAAAERAGVECVLVGDSLGNVIQGQKSTVPVTLDQMIYHTSCVSRGLQRCLLIADMPYMSYATIEQTMVSAAKLMQAGAGMVKLEGGAWLASTVAALAERGIPVCAHLGLLPQSVDKIGGYRIQGRDAQEAEQILSDALLLQESGADLLVLEMVPAALAEQISQQLSIPVIGIGAGNGTDAQVLVMYDLIGLSPRVPRFVRNFLAETNSIEEALKAYVLAVQSREFPSTEQTLA